MRMQSCGVRAEPGSHVAFMQHEGSAPLCQTVCLPGMVCLPVPWRAGAKQPELLQWLDQPPIRHASKNASKLEFGFLR